MKLKFIKPRKNKKTAKLTLRANGVIGLSAEARKSLMSDSNKFLKFGISDTDGIFIKTQSFHDVECFTISKSGQYSYVKKSNSLLEALGVEIGDKVCFDFGYTTDGFTEIIKRKI